MKFHLLCLMCAPVLAVAACHGGHGANVPGNGDDHLPFHAIGADETVHFVGAEPFWGGKVTGKTMTYATPENAKGTAVPVSRFAGRGGLSFSGELDGKPLTLAITPAACSDGMSDARYPFAVTLRLGDDLRQGCGWTARQPRTGGPA